MACKNSRGFSYVEILIAMALFAIAMLAIIPTLSQAGRNMLFAQRAYDSHMQAQRTMLVVREALEDGANPGQRALAYADGNFEFSFRIHGQNSMDFHSSTQHADINITGINAAMATYATVIVVVVWGEDEQVAGRAVGVLY